MRFILIALVVSTLLCGAARACLWDSDTLDYEAKGLPGVVSVLTGRFERQPPLYYQMRLDRVSGELTAHPERLALYDDAGVASDRLGRSDEAVLWMRKKASAMRRFGATADDRYRYHANLGTFLVHGWFKSGADRRSIAQVRLARHEIAAAITINPEAHFGRERYQLAALDWLIAGPERSSLEDHVLKVAPGADHLEKSKAAVRGLSGLVVLGNAWESVDVFLALQYLLRFSHQSSLGFLAGSRAVELMEAGKTSLGSPSNPQDVLDSSQNGLLGASYTAAERKYRELRAEADRWHNSRTEFMLARLSAGRHPDTDPFWDGYRSSRAPSLAPSWWEWMQIRVLTVEGVIEGLKLLPMLIVAVLLARWLRRKLAVRRSSKLLSEQRSG